MSRDTETEKTAEELPVEEQSQEKESAEEVVEREDVSETEQLQQQLDEAKEQALRIQAEMQNLRRRTERDVENAHKFALDKFAADLLPVVDNLERALTAINPEEESQKAVSEGIELTLKSFVDVLEKFKVEQVDPAGEPFDPEFHQAMTMVPNPDVEANTVMDVFQKGYTLNGRLIRPAMVVVSK